MADNHAGVNIGGIIGGKKNTVNNFNSFHALQLDDLNSLLSELRSAIGQLDIPEERKREAGECVDAIQEEAGKEKPKKSVIKLTFDRIKEIASDEKLLKVLEKLTPIIIALIE